jgi:hypothetical protein
MCSTNSPVSGDLEVLVAAGSAMAKVLRICGLPHADRLRQVDPP